MESFVLLKDPAMANQHITDIKSFLANSSLHATPEWVEGCVEFFVAEHENQGVSLYREFA